MIQSRASLGVKRLYDKDLLIAVPEDLTKNAMLQSFELEVNSNMGDASAVALAKTLKQNATLQSSGLFD